MANSRVTNPAAASLRGRGKKVVPAKKGRGSYNRKKLKPEEMKASGKAKKSRVNEAGNYTKPTMRKRLFNKIKAGSKGGKPGQWSARKAQMLAKQYKAAGGGYRD